MTEVHRLDQAHLDAVLDLDAVCFSGDPFAPNWWHKAVATDGASGWILLRHQSVVAYCLFSEVLDQAELLRIAVHPSQRGRGLGIDLLRHAQAELSRRGMTELFLEVRASNRAAQALYHRCGWEPCGRRRNYYPLGDAREDALLFSWQP